MACTRYRISLVTPDYFTSQSLEIVPINLRFVSLILKFYPVTDPISGDWIRVATDSILRLTRVSVAEYDLRLSRVLAAGLKLRLIRVPAAGCKLRLTPSYSWLEFRRLNTSCSWLCPTAESSSGSLIRLTVDSSCGWLWVVVDSILRLIWVRGLEAKCGWLILNKFKVK